MSTSRRSTFVTTLFRIDEESTTDLTTITEPSPAHIRESSRLYTRRNDRLPHYRSLSPSPPPYRSFDGWMRRSLLDGHVPTWLHAIPERRDERSNSLDSLRTALDLQSRDEESEIGGGNVVRAPELATLKSVLIDCAKLLGVSAVLAFTILIAAFHPWSK